jgi:molybdopterin-guanine dinucleotide biosynthesis protein A
MTTGDPSAATVGAIVLAGGRSARFGRDKLAEPIDGRPLLHHAIAAVLAVASEVVVVVAPDADRPVPDGVRVVRDPVAFEGPLAGLATGLAALTEDAGAVVVVAGDMPTIAPDILRLLLEVLDGPPAIAATVLDDGGPMPMAVSRAAALAATKDLLDAGERRLRALPERLAATTIPGARWRTIDPAGRTLRDIDRPSDL